MLLKLGLISSGGNEITIKSDTGEKYTLSKADAVREGLYDVDAYPLEYDDTEYLEFLHQKLKAVKYCQYLLSFSDKSSKVLMQKLREKEYSADVAQEALKVLKDAGLSDEKEMCVKKLHSLANTKLYGKSRIRAELIAKGFSRCDIDCSLDECDIDFYELALRLFTKLANAAGLESTRDEALIKVKTKMSRYGYSFDEIRYAVNEYFS